MILCIQTSLVPSQGKIQVLRCNFRLAGRHIRRHNFRLLRPRTYVVSEHHNLHIPHVHAHAIQTRCRLPCLWLEKMSETSVKIIKNEVRCRDDTVPKTVDTRKHCKVGLRACNNLLQPPPYIFVFRGCGRLLHALNPTLQCFLVSTAFGMVSSLHLIS